jgi:hypothetical protein
VQPGIIAADAAAAADAGLYLLGNYVADADIAVES